MLTAFFIVTKDLTEAAKGRKFHRVQSFRDVCPLWWGGHDRAQQLTPYHGSQERGVNRKKPESQE